MNDLDKKTAETITKNFTELNNKESKKIDVISTIGLSVTYFCLGMMTQYFIHRKDVSKFINKTRSDLNKFAVESAKDDGGNDVEES